MQSFSELNLIPSLLETLNEKGLNTPTEIQAKAIPALLSRDSIVGVSETGSGKTLAYALPVLHLLKSLENDGKPVFQDSLPRAAIIVPTRELGEQVAKVFKIFTHTTRLRVRTVLGGTAMDVAKKNVQGKFEILVATPGRLVQLIDRNHVSLSDVGILVFDEADQMLDPGFLDDAGHIAESCSRDRQMVLFSATVSPSVQELMKKLFSKAEVIRSEGHHRVVPTLTTMNKQVVDGKRFPLLEKIIATDVKGGTIIFTNTREQCDKLATEMKAAGRDCVIYRGEMDKVERRFNLKSFREGKTKYLISTDLASRGLDLEHVGRVINYHMPKDIENYIHRVGRTARAGRPGLVINFLTERDKLIANQIKSL